MMEVEKAHVGFPLPATKDIDFLLEQAPVVKSTLESRIHWLFEMIDWIRYSGLERTRFDFGTGPRQVMRMQYFLNLLDSNPGWKKRVAQVLRSIIHDTHGLEFFLQTGMPSGEHFWGELFSRIGKKFLLQAPQHQELHFIFGEHIRKPEDIQWMELLDPSTLERLIELFHFDVSVDESDWNTLRKDAGTALLILAVQAQGVGFSYEIRRRLQALKLEENPFLDLPPLVEKFIQLEKAQDRQAIRTELEALLQKCLQAVAQVRSSLSQEGVSIGIVYQLERVEALLRRIKDLMSLLAPTQADPMIVSEFMENLILENLKSRSVRNLISENFSVIARRISEKTGESGEKYITRNLSEYFQMIRKAFGGGVVTAGTTLVKILIYVLQWPLLQSGFLAGANYALSFLMIHFCQFTLGTKQPSMTASALASRMNGDLETLVDEVMHLIRSQFIAIVGNVLGVIPAMLFVCWAYQMLVQAPLLTPEKAMHTLHDFSVLGPTPLYAYFTGVLLWLSSVFSGWVENWFVFHKMTAALASHRGLRAVLGVGRAVRWARFLRRHVLGISANISLGLLLGFLPSVLQYFWDLQIEVRHVTLSSGSLVAAVMSLPSTIFQTWDFWLAVLGILSMALLNVTVSFGLALLVAVKARQVQAPKRQQIYQAVYSRIKRKPISLFWPGEKQNIP